jgi:hypothetical protein
MSEMRWLVPCFAQLRLLRVPALRLWTSCAGGPKIKGEGLPEGLRGREGWSSILLGWYRLGGRKLGTWIVVGVRKLVRA